MPIDDHLQARLLALARDSIQSFLAGEPAPQPSAAWPNLPCHGVFVTLRKGGLLRGCIGVFSESADLAGTVRCMAVAAARDPRFADQPISASELQDLRIEISLLSARRRLSNPLDFEIGTDGVYVRRGAEVGCFLPDVAIERGWGREKFLSECCTQKAAISPMAWKEPETEVYAFSVEKFADGPV